MVMGVLNAHINGDEQDYIVNDSDDFLDDFLPQNYIVDCIQKICNTELYQKTNEYGKYVHESNNLRFGKIFNLSEFNVL
jgi:hypothetical protein